MQFIRVIFLISMLAVTLYLCNRRLNRPNIDTQPKSVKFANNSDVTLVTMSFQEFTRSSYSDFSRVNKQRFCEVTGCKYLEGNSQVTDKAKAVWEKIPFVLKAFTSQNPLIWMLDFDTIIMNSFFSVSSVIDDQHDFFITKDCKGFNAGSVIVRVNDWTNSFLKEVLKKRDDTQTISLSDSAIMAELYESNWNDAQNHIKVLNQASINAYPKEINCSEEPYEKGKHPVLHFASCDIMGICGSLFKFYMYDTDV